MTCSKGPQVRVKPGLLLRRTQQPPNFYATVSLFFICIIYSFVFQKDSLGRRQKKDRWERGDDVQQRATCKSGILSHCSQDTASVHRAPAELLGRPMCSNLIETREWFVSRVHKTALQVLSVVKWGLNISVFLSSWPPRYGSPETQVGAIIQVIHCLRLILFVFFSLSSRSKNR